MLNAEIIKKYATQSDDVILEANDNFQDLVYAFLAHLLTNQKESSIAILKKIIKNSNLDHVKTEVKKALGHHKLDFNKSLFAGQVIKHSLPYMPVKEGFDEELKDSQFVYVIGTSNSRGFGTSPYFFSIFTHIGHQAFLLDEDKFQNTFERAKIVIERLERDKPVMVIMGAEPRLLLDNRFEMRDYAFGELLQSDYDHMDHAAKQYKKLGLELEKHAHGPIYFLVPLPTLNVETNTLTRYMIERLNEEFKDTNLGIIDPFEDFIDNKTGLMDESLQIVKDEDELHFNHDGLLAIIRQFVDKDLLPADAITAPLYHWDNLIQLVLNNEEMVRIWNDPAKSLKSNMTGATVMGENVIYYLIGLSLDKNNNKYLILNAKQGFIPINIPVGIAEEILSVSFNEQDRETCKRLYAFGNRKEIKTIDFDSSKDIALHSGITDICVCIYPEDNFEDIHSKLEELIAAHKPLNVLIYATNNHPEYKVNNDNYDKVIAADLSRRHIAEDWKTCTLTHYKLKD